MYGYFYNIIKNFVEARFGPEIWKSIVRRSQTNSHYEELTMYNEKTLRAILSTSSSVLGLQQPALLEMIGEYYLDHIRQKGYDHLLRNLGESMLVFLENLDYLHTSVMSEYPEARMPSFRCAPNSSPDNITLHYYSYRQGLDPLVMGILKAVAKTYFKSDLHIEVVSRTKEELKKGGRDGLWEHVVFSLVLTKRTTAENMAPPTFVAQTKKHAEKQILQEDVTHVMARLEQIRKDKGDSSPQLSRSRAVGAKWKTVAKLSMLYGGFNAQYPAELSINCETFCHSFPYHLVFNSKMTIVHSGVKIQQALPAVRNPGTRMDTYFELLHPRAIDFNFRNVKNFLNTPFILNTKPPDGTMAYKGHVARGPITLRGQMVVIQEKELVIYLCSPYVRSLQELEDRNIFLGDIPIHDVTRELLWMQLLARHHEKPDTTSPASARDLRHGGLHVSAVPNYWTTPVPGLSAYTGNDVEDVRRELATVREQLEAEKRRCAWLQTCLLPPSAAEVILQGEIPRAEKYKEATVLFSDVVEFSQLVQRAQAHDVVNLLTSLHKKFNRICMVHTTHRVEIIGDAYMVVSGAPDPIATHAQRIANTALAMLLVVKEVTSPLAIGDRSPSIQIRVGIHSGSVVAGVIGGKIPRFAVMGPAVIHASRLESHGIPGKIQISDHVNKLLKCHGFRTERRGLIDMRGQGRVQTHFLLENTDVSTEELLGSTQRMRNQAGVDVAFVNERLERPRSSRSSDTNGSRSPLIQPNRVYPVQRSNTSTPGSNSTDLDGDDVIPMAYSDDVTNRVN